MKHAKLLVLPVVAGLSAGLLAQQPQSDPVTGYSSAAGEDRQVISPRSDSEETALPPESKAAKSALSEKSVTQTIRDCSRLYIDRYEKPNLSIADQWIYVELGPQVTNAQLRHVPSGGIRLFKNGRYRVPPGDYVLSLHGHNYGRNYVWACVTYQP